MAWRAIERLRPNVPDTVFDDVVRQGLAVWSDGNGNSNVGAGIEIFRGGLGVRSYVNESNLACARLRGGIGSRLNLRHPSAVWRKVHATEYESIGNCACLDEFRRAPVYGHLHHPKCSPIIVVKRCSIRRAERRFFVLTVR